MPRRPIPLTLDQKLAKGLITQEYYDQRKEVARKLEESIKEEERKDKEESAARQKEYLENEASIARRKRIEDLLAASREKKAREMRMGKLATFQMMLLFLLP